MNTSLSKSYRAPIRVTPLRRFFIFILTPLLKMLAKVSVRGVEHFPVAGGAIVACNHVSFFDGFALQLALPRPIYFMGKEENFKNPFLRFFMYQIGAFPVKRGTYDRGALDQALRILKSGELLGMFPEGTRTYGKGLIEAKGGAAILAIKINCPIVPVALAGTQNILKRGLKRSEVMVTVCPPVIPDKEITPVALTQKYMQVMADNLPPALRGIYA
jgi:1-acyl-sn-glycerol-3-phosphate acyltransferase